MLAAIIATNTSETTSRRDGGSHCRPTLASFAYVHYYSLSRIIKYFRVRNNFHLEKHFTHLCVYKGEYGGPYPIISVYNNTFKATFIVITFPMNSYSQNILCALYCVNFSINFATFYAPGIL